MTSQVLLQQNTAHITKYYIVDQSVPARDTALQFNNIVSELTQF